MDKALFRAYVRELVKEMVEDEVKKALPKLLDEAVREIKTLKENAPVPTPQKKFSRAQLAEMMGLERIGDDTMVARGGNVTPTTPGVASDNPAIAAINKDYSALMKKMGLSK